MPTCQPECVRKLRQLVRDEDRNSPDRGIYSKQDIVYLPFHQIRTTQLRLLLGVIPSLLCSHASLSGLAKLLIPLWPELEQTIIQGDGIESAL